MVAAVLGNLKLSSPDATLRCLPQAFNLKPLTPKLKPSAFDLMSPIPETFSPEFRQDHQSAEHMKERARLLEQQSESQQLEAQSASWQEVKPGGSYIYYQYGIRSENQKGGLIGFHIRTRYGPSGKSFAPASRVQGLGYVVKGLGFTV